MEKVLPLSRVARWMLACGVVLIGLLATFLLEGLLADNVLAFSSDARDGFLLVGAIVSIALGVLTLGIISGVLLLTDPHASTDRRPFGSLFWRLFASYFVATLATALIATYVGRFEGPFRALIGTPLVEWFNHVGANDTNSAALFVAIATVIGTLTGLLVSLNLRRRLRAMTRATLAWSRGDFSASVRDRTSDELGQLACDLNRMAEQIQTLLTSRQALAVVEERNRLARDLHDTVKQHVFANVLLVRAARKQLDRDPEVAKQHLLEAEALAELTQQELIALIQALRPAALADRGLAALLRDHTREWAQRSGVRAELRVQGERATPLDAEEALYRLAQEALTNIARHSGATHAEVQLSWDETQVRLLVRDNGHGFDPTQTDGKGLGLASMRERVEALGGMLRLSSSPGGACVKACVPLAGVHTYESLEVAP